MDNNVTITYEKLFELLRLEKSKEELQELDVDFFAQVCKYLCEKQAILDKSSDNEFAIKEQEATRKQLVNIKRIIKELYERRKKKIILLALYKARTNSNILKLPPMLKEEQSLFDELLRVFEWYRGGVLNCLVNGKEIGLEKIQVDNNGGKDDEANSSENVSKNVLLRFLHTVPKFMGEDLQVFGPFEQEDVAHLPSRIAQVLINKKRAEKIDHKKPL